MFFREKILLVICLIAIFSVEKVHATKCFLKTDLTGIKELFPVVIKGKVTNRTPIKGREKSYLVEMQVLETIKGALEDKYMTFEEQHLAGFNNHTYQIGSIYYFPISIKPNEKIKSVHIPAPGCPSLPKIDR